MSSLYSTTSHSAAAAFVSGPVGEDTLAEAVEQSKGDYKPLADLRLAIKDLFHIKGIPTAAGNPTWLATHPIPDASNTSVIKLIQSGARYVGKTLTDELAYSLNGQNIHYPPLLNPLTPARMVGGSSSGSAAAVASDLADIGLGTDTGGSIRVPASYNGLFGLRTTHGLLHCDNMVALAPSFDTIGWMCKTIENLYRVAQVLLPKSQFQKIQTLEEQSDSTLANILRKPRIYKASNLIDKAEHALEIEAWLNSLTNVSITNAVFDLDALHTSETFRILQGDEIWQQHGEWILEQQPRFADDVNARFKWCKNLSVEQKQIAQRQQQVVNQELTTIFETHDLMLIPTTPGRSPLLGQSADTMAIYREDLMSLTALAGLSGRPQIHLPLFTIDNAPCGVSLIGNKNSDLFLILLASELIKQSTSFTLAKQAT